jgi:hypothetical protein
MAHAAGISVRDAGTGITISPALRLPHADGTAAISVPDGDADELDAHFLALFTPSDLMGRDGRKHEKVMS